MGLSPNDGVNFILDFGSGNSLQAHFGYKMTKAS